MSTSLDPRNRAIKETGSTDLSQRPARTMLAMAGLAVAAAVAGQWLSGILAPQADPTTRRLVVVVALAAAALFWTSRIGWSRVAAGGPSGWRNLRLLSVPVAVALVPLLWGWTPPTAGALAVLVVGYAATGVYEELWFRGIMLRVASTLGPVRAATATAVLFGMSHLTNIVFGQNIWVTASQAVGATAFGFGYAILRWRTNAIWLLVAVHAVGDLLFHTTGLHGGLLALVLVGHDVLVLGWGLLLVRSARPQLLATPDPDDDLTSSGSRDGSSGRSPGAEPGPRPSDAQLSAVLRGVR